MNAIKVAVHAGDPLTRMVLTSQVQSASRFTLLPWVSACLADVVVVVVEVVDQRTLQVLNELGIARSKSLLVVGRPTVDRSVVVGSGVRAVLWRKEFTPARFVQVLCQVGEGLADLPSTAGHPRPTAPDPVRSDPVLPAESEPDAPGGIGLSSREVEILRLAAEGHDILEICRKVCYSERTIRNVFNDLMRRLNLRNRTHVVAYALRSGLI